MNSNKTSYEPRTAIYKLPADVARAMYKNRPASEKKTPFMEYLIQCAKDDNLLWPITKVELY